MILKNLVESEYKDISAEEEKTILTKKNKSVEKLLRIYEEGLENIPDQLSKITDRDFESFNGIDRILQRHNCVSYTSADITEFCMYLPTYESHPKFIDSGIFLSSLIYLHYERTKQKEEYLLPINSFTKKLEKICLSNDGAHVRIIGSVGNNFGEYMKSGTLILEGDADNCVGYQMYGGNISIKGNVLDRLCYHMMGGTVTIHGNIKGDMGHFIQRGKIIVYGDIEKINSIERWNSNVVLIHKDEIIRGRRISPEKDILNKKN